MERRDFIFFARERKVSPRSVRENQPLLAEYQSLLESHGMPIRWP